jgi:hypothetical protein
MSMIRRLSALMALLLYGSLDRVAGLIPDDAEYPEDHDPLASASTGADAPAAADRGLATRLLAS